MKTLPHHHHPDEGPHTPSDHSIPYWQRAHKDWRFWVGVGFLIAAIAVYVVTVDLSLVPRAQTPSASVSP